MDGWRLLSRGSSPVNNTTLFRMGTHAKSHPLAHGECKTDRLHGQQQHGDPLGPASVRVRVLGTAFDEIGDVPLKYYNIDKNVWITLRTSQCGNPAIAALKYKEGDKVRLVPHPRDPLAPDKPSLLLEILLGPNGIQPPTPLNQAGSAAIAVGDDEAVQESEDVEEPQNQAGDNGDLHMFGPGVQQEQPHGGAAEEELELTGTEDTGNVLLNIAAGCGGRDGVAPRPHQNVPRRQVQEHVPQNAARGSQGAGPSRQRNQATPTRSPTSGTKRALDELLASVRREAEAEFNMKLNATQKHAKAAVERAAAATAEISGLKRKLAETQQKLNKSDKQKQKLQRRFNRTMEALQHDSSDDEDEEYEPSSSSDDEDADGDAE